MLAVAGIGVYGILLAGWSSGSTYPLLGGLRSSAQIISYEIAMGLSLVAVFLYAGSMSTSEIVYAQSAVVHHPAVFPFVVYVITMVGETNRLPFDLAEGEGELTGGFHTEYSSLKFAMFFLAEYINMVTVSALATTLFLGGWRAPPGIAAINDGMFNDGLVAAAVVRRQAVDVPVRLRLAARLAAPGALRPVHAVRLEVPDPRQARLDRGRRVHPRRPERGSMGCDLPRRSSRSLAVLVGVIAVVALVVGWIVGPQPRGRGRRGASPPCEGSTRSPGGYPVPPLPGQSLVEPSPTQPALTASGSRRRKEAARG